MGASKSSRNVYEGNKRKEISSIPHHYASIHPPKHTAQTSTNKQPTSRIQYHKGPPPYPLLPSPLSGLKPPEQHNAINSTRKKAPTLSIRISENQPPHHPNQHTHHHLPTSLHRCRSSPERHDTRLAHSRSARPHDSSITRACATGRIS